ncbi:hypothetical protein EYF80_024018 [Liparis tanakae]|uniref:Uncharacterized protein n=1 Tax=Liparis tanakae TaxID=230148 RepID=A0A4Z2HKB3_9TELE|nr:hypothetical protein EYF80_024018 [Liparis tanakae]
MPLPAVLTQGQGSWGRGVSGSPCRRRWHNTATGSAGSAGAPDSTAGGTDMEQEVEEEEDKEGMMKRREEEI